MFFLVYKVSQHFPISVAQLNQYKYLQKSVKHDIETITFQVTGDYIPKRTQECLSL